MQNLDEIKGVWKQQVGAAKISLGKLTEDELLQVQGRRDRLAGLVQERYGLARADADRQVKEFFEKLKR